MMLGIVSIVIKIPALEEVLSDPIFAVLNSSMSNTNPVAATTYVEFYSQSMQRCGTMLGHRTQKTTLVTGCM